MGEITMWGLLCANFYCKNGLAEFPPEERWRTREGRGMSMLQREEMGLKCVVKGTG